ncbi:histidine triad nucleotide-binding protein [candidate division KSB1 bacterium]|nr:histidine triad nucleotide-binding protein [candidate division KSB1 bacterium]
MPTCIFCQIASKQQAAEILFENDQIVAFRDINPQAPHHILIIPRTHIATVNDLQSADAALIGNLILAAQTLARDLKLSQRGFRLVFNCNADGGQAVYHLHLHLLGGRKFGWPPG